MDNINKLKELVLKMDAIEKVEQLKKFHERGLLSDEELYKQVEEQYMRVGVDARVMAGLKSENENLLIH